jgi:hypothetical protein
MNPNQQSHLRNLLRTTSIIVVLALLPRRSCVFEEEDVA